MCNEIARYFTVTAKGVKYTHSKRTLEIKGEKLLYKIYFGTSHYDTVGSWVCLEIVPNVLALDKTNIEREGIFSYLGHNKSYNVYDINYDMFFEIINYIKDELKNIKKLKTKEGFEEYLKTKNEFQLKFIYEKTKSFHLFNDKISYIIRIMENNQAEQLYYGKCIHDKENFEYKSHKIYKGKKIH